ncbi:MAG: hypothetical protein KJN59_09905, partial [Bacteroidia bacterium]|nr:hypothetical protein [Bacteroidia bacterium]
MAKKFNYKWMGLILLCLFCNFQWANGQIVDLPDYQLEECNAEWPKHLVTEWKDKCGGAGEVISDAGVDYELDKDDCIQYRLYTFVIKDKCGTLLKETTLVSREYDMTSPEISDLDDFKLEGCNSPWPPFLISKWSDNCSAGGEIQSDGGGEITTNEDGCTQSRVYTFAVTDDCDNSATETTTVTRIYDETSPEIEDLDDFQLEDCNAEWPPFLISKWSDNCSQGGEAQSDGGGEITTSEDGCTQSRDYTFTVSDDCENTTTETTTVTRIYDEIPPEIIDLEDFQLEGCNAEWPEKLTTTWSDNCSEGGDIDSDSGGEVTTSEDGCNQSRVYTFTVSDDCENTTMETTTVTRIYDEIPPEIVDLEDFQLDGCNAEWPEKLTTTWSDNCSEGGDIDSDSGGEVTTSEDGCTQSRVYTFTVSDDCQNTTMETTTVTRIYDEIPPEITDLDDFLLEGCNAEWPEKLTTTWSDNCSEGGDIDSDSGGEVTTSEDGCT